jgi:radical SAM-linked protein
VCGPKDCHGCAPFARDCVKGLIAETTGRPLDSDLPLLATPSAPGPGVPAAVSQVPPRLPRRSPTELREDDALRPRYRYRGRFTKTGRLRFLSHLDVYRLLMRALRRAGVTLVYSQGFNPKPRVAFGPALSVGVASEGEYLDFDSHDRLDHEPAMREINEVLPEGIRFCAIREIARDVPTLGDAICAARYRTVGHGFDPAPCLEDFRERSPVTVRREKNGKVRTFDLDVEMLKLALGDDESVRMTLAVRNNGASVRPEEVLRGIFGERAGRIGLVREELLVEWRGRMINPLLAAAVAHAHRAVR